MRKKEKPPLIQTIMTPRGLRAHTQDDAEKLASIPEGTIFEIAPVTKRSDKQLRTYWKALGLVVKVTQKWGSAENLHRDIKMTFGYREQVVNLRTGEITLVPDSIALDKMSHEEFCEFMNQAMALIADTVGFDPLAFLAEERAA
ncbi:hypothetical protein [Neorhizobium sp. S3-V5DH]|uniref:hypothetical protein n=1 Tax=Neorhizobium sp. S3-V5DH TaxID=2485166 RepID=UPI00104DEA35|nr:hypothetical protein [Neorhizobium sp. S3-V5DH]TCV66321.1 hypothetical protein EDE09_11672 [Neorhizobium sp. S3-V5DH]